MYLFLNGTQLTANLFAEELPGLNCAKNYGIGIHIWPKRKRRVTGAWKHKTAPLTGLLAAIALLLAMTACQPNQPTLTVGFVSQLPGQGGLLDGFKAVMSNLGYIEGDNVAYIHNGSTDFEVRPERGADSGQVDSGGSVEHCAPVDSYSTQNSP